MDKRELYRRFLIGVTASVLICIAGCQGDSGQAGTLQAQHPGEEVTMLDPTDAIAKIASTPVPDGVDEDVWDRLTAALAGMLANTGSAKLMSGPPSGAAGAAGLTYIASISTLEWLYVNPGDYDQNGEVGISDLTPIGVYYGVESPGGLGEPFPEDCAEAVIDGNGDGLIGIADITPIGANFGNAVDGYRIYLADIEASHPQEPDLPNGADTVWIGSIGFKDAAMFQGRLRSNYQIVPTQTEQFYWVRPYHAGADGAASNAVSVALPPPMPPVADLIATGERATLAHVIWDATASHDPDGQIVSYEWDFNSDGVYEHETDVAAVDFYYYTPGVYQCTVRMTDNDAMTATDSGTIQINEGASWHSSIVDSKLNPPGSSSSDRVFADETLLDVEGRPALVYSQLLDELDVSTNSWFETVYLRGVDTHGESWAEPQHLPGASRTTSTGESALRIEANVVDGLPAVVYPVLHELESPPAQFDYQIDQVYTRANDAAGGSWPINKLISSYMVSDPNFQTMEGVRVSDTWPEIDGAPALFGLSYTGGSSEDYVCLKAQNPTGSSWPSQWTVFDTPPYTNSNLCTMIDGALACILNKNFEDILFYLSTSTAPIQWGEPVLVDQLENAYGNALINAGGFPAVIYFDNLLSGIKYRRAANPEGTIWLAPVVLTTAGKDLYYLATVIDGRPVVLYEDRVTDTVKMIASNDEVGALWGFPLEVTDINLTFSMFQFKDIAGEPAFAYADSIELALDEYETQMYYWAYY